MFWMARAGLYYRCIFIYKGRQKNMMHFGYRLIFPLHLSQRWKEETKQSGNVTFTCVKVLSDFWVFLSEAVNRREKWRAICGDLVTCKSSTFASAGQWWGCALFVKTCP